MSNPPAGWYPDPTGQPHTIRYWNGQKWTNKTQHEDEPTDDSTDSTTAGPPQQPTASQDSAPFQSTASQDSAASQEPAPFRDSAASQAPAASEQQWPAQQSGGGSNEAAWSADQQPWSAAEFTAYDQPDASTEQTQPQSWSGQDRSGADTTQQQWGAQQFPADIAQHQWGDAQQSSADTTQQQWGGVQQSGAGPDQPAWSADNQPWSADQFTAYDQPDASTEQTQPQPWSGQEQSGADTTQQQWGAQQSPTDSSQQWGGVQQSGSGSGQPAWSADNQPWGADEFTAYEPADVEQTQIQPAIGQQPASPDYEPNQQQAWSNQQQSHSDPTDQQWGAQQTSADPTQQQWGAQQTGADPTQQQWGQQQFGTGSAQDHSGQQAGMGAAQQPWGAQSSGGSNQPAWSADPQPWGADQFSSYEPAEPSEQGASDQLWGSQSDDNNQSPRHPGPSQQGESGGWNAQQTWPLQQPTDSEQAAQPQQSWPDQDTAEGPQLWPGKDSGTELRAVQHPGTTDSAASDQSNGGWWQSTATPQPWNTTQPTDNGPGNGPRLRAVSPEEYPQPAQSAEPMQPVQSVQAPHSVHPAQSVQSVQSAQSARVDQSAQGGAAARIVGAANPDVPGQKSASDSTAGLTAAERARATWGAPELAPAPAEHWTQRDISELEAANATLSADVPADDARPSQPVTPTLKLAPVPTEPGDPSTPQEADQAGATPRTDTQAVGQPTHQSVEAEDAGSASATAARVADEAAARQAADDAELAGQVPDWGSQAGDEQEDAEPSDVPAWGVEADDEATEQTSEKAGQLWSVPESTDSAQDQPIQLWGDQSQDQNQSQSWGDQQATPQAQGWDQQSGQQTAGPDQSGAGQQSGQVWGSQQGTTGSDAGSGWGGVDQHGVQEASLWGQDTHQAGQSWNNGQSWPLQESGSQQSANGWDNQQNSQQSGPHQWGGQPGPVGTQPPAQPAWGEGNEAWGSKTDLSSGVGKREKGKTKKSTSAGGGGPFGGKLPLMIAGGVALVLLIVAAVVLLTNGDDKTADPQPTGTPTQSTSASPSNGVSPGQSKNPKLHEGNNRISSDAISFPRRKPPWSDHKLFVPQVRNAGGQRILLQENAAGTQDDWSADIFVGGLGTGSGFDGDPKATAATLATQLQSTMYGNIPVTFKAVANGPVKRTDKSGWFFQQTVTATAPTVPSRVLTLTVAVFDLGDGTAVAYVSGIPTNRPDLKAAADEAFKGIQVG